MEAILTAKSFFGKNQRESKPYHIPQDLSFERCAKPERARKNHRCNDSESSLISFCSVSSLRGEPISKNLAQDAIRNIAKEEESGVITLQQIQKLVAATYKLSVDELLSKNNARHISHPRQIAMYLCKNLTKHSYHEIGRAFGGKHHTTVIHSVEKIEGLVSSDETLQKLINELSESLQR